MNFRRDAEDVIRRGVSEVKISVFEAFDNPPQCRDVSKESDGFAVRSPALAFRLAKSSLGNGFLIF